MKIALVDDEKKYIDNIAVICHKFGSIKNLDIETSGFLDGESFLHSLGGSNYSVVFLDIYMNGIDGIATAHRLREHDTGCVLIFLTSSGHHMPDAFSCHAFEYIQKPFTEQRVFDVLEDALKILPVHEKYMNLYSDRKTIPVLLDEIVFIMTDAHYLHIELANKKPVRCRMTVSQFMEQADDPRFIPVNKGVAVNADHIVDFENNCCLMDNGTQLPIRIRDHLKIEQSIRNYNFDKIRSRQHGR